MCDSREEHERIQGFNLRLRRQRLPLTEMEEQSILSEKRSQEVIFENIKQIIKTQKNIYCSSIFSNIVSPVRKKTQIN